MKNITSPILAIVIIFNIHTLNCEAFDYDTNVIFNETVLDMPYEKITKAVLTNLNEQEYTLVHMKNVDRATMTKLWMQLLNQVVRCRILDFNRDARENMVFVNMSPPQGRGYLSGVAPWAITNTEDRKAYEKVLRINHEKFLHLNFEMDMQRLDESCNYFALIHIRQAYKANADDAKELAGFIDSIEDENHKAELKKNLKNILDAKK